LFIALVLSSFIYLDYSIYGTLLIFIIYFFIDNRKKLFVALLVYLSIGFIGNDISLLGLSFSKQGFAILALPIIFFKTNINIYFNKYFYYSFYPIHLFGLLLYIRIK
ncbi:MAG: TraX family protein, partial [Clostridiales bacterium]